MRGGAWQTFTGSGVARLDSGMGRTDTAAADGHLVESPSRGANTARYRTDNGVIRYVNEAVTRRGAVTIKVNRFCSLCGGGTIARVL